MAFCLLNAGPFPPHGPTDAVLTTTSAVLPTLRATTPSDINAVASARISPKLSDMTAPETHSEGPSRRPSPAQTPMQARPLPLVAFAAAALSPLALIGIGAAVGGLWLWSAFLYMAVLTVLLDQMIPLTAGQTDDAEFPAADALLIATGLGALILLPLATWAVAGPSALTTGERVLLLFATGFWLGQVGHPAAHELIHRPSRSLFRLGAAYYSAILFGQHTSAHRLVHHRHVASRDDPNTARAGESFYRFAPRAWIGSFRDGARAETTLRAGRGLHPYLLYLTGSATALTLATLIAGVPGLLAWIGLALHAQSQILLSDYVQHYGLTRAQRPDGKLEPVGPAHSWNTAHWFTSAMMLNAPRHSDHHVHPARAFPALALSEDAPRLPWPLPLACALALAPRTWRRAIAPHLARWRNSRPAEAHQDTSA